MHYEIKYNLLTTTKKSFTYFFSVKNEFLRRKKNEYEKKREEIKEEKISRIFIKSSAINLNLCIYILFFYSFYLYIYCGVKKKKKKLAFEVSK